MNPFHRSQVTDELLSAYIDGDVTAEEKKLVERAVQSDANVAWRLESLQQTVNLLRTLPEMPLPRSFVLTEADVAPVKPSVPPVVSAARRTARPRMIEPAEGGFWRSFKEFLQGGSPALRNMAAAGLAVWVMLFGVTVLNPSRIVVPTSTQVEALASLESPADQEASAAVREVAVAHAESDNSTQANNEGQEENQVENTVAPSEAPQALADLAAADVAASNEIAQPAPENSARVAKSAPAAGETLDSANSEAETQTQPAPAPQALRLDGSANSSSGMGEDPLAQAMSDGGESGGMGGGEMSAAAVESASSTVITSGEANPTFADTTTVATEQPAAGAIQPYAVEAQPIPETQGAIADAPTQESVAAETVSQEQPTAENSTAPDQAIAEEEAVVEEQATAEPVTNQNAVTAAPTVEVALANPVSSSSEKVQSQQVQPQVAEAVPMPLFDPIRIQIAQVTVALVTAVLALFWLASQRGKNSK